MKTFIDSFAGIGGFHVALSKRGLECAVASEIDKAAYQSYEAKYGLKPRGDICNFFSRNIPRHDIFCAGIPHQPFSRSGKLGRLGDMRGELFYETVRIAKHHEPELILLENVKEILTIDNGNVQPLVYSALEKIGYRIKHVLLNASKFGIPQQKERVYFVAIRKNSSLSFEDVLQLQVKKIIKILYYQKSKQQVLL